MIKLQAVLLADQEAPDWADTADERVNQASLAVARNLGCLRDRAQAAQRPLEEAKCRALLADGECSMPPLS